MSDSNGHEKPAATVKDVAGHFGVSERTVWRWLKETDIPHRRIGGVVRFKLEELDEWSGRGDPSSESTVATTSET